MISNNTFTTSKLKKPTILLGAFLASIFIAGCAEEEVQTETAIIEPTVKLSAATDMPNFSEFEFPAEVSAVKTIDVSFEVAGRLQDVNLRTGSIVKKGDLLAQVDPTEFTQRLNEAKTRLEQAKRDLDRATATFEKGLAAQSQLDNAKTNYELAQIAINRAQKDLSYTSVKAPFDAQISQRLVDNNNFVKAGDIIAKLQDVSRFYFNINVPERLLTGYKQGAEIEAAASIISAPEKMYQLEYVEHATQADPITQTYKVVFAAATTDPSLTPGARAKVLLKLGYQRYGDGLLIPVTALVGNNSEGFHVWKFDPKTREVVATEVEVLFVKNQQALVKSTLNAGDEVVAAGTTKMREGLVVKPYNAEL
ncbi:efflux RND transporter periplasmic adaptor subunit [Psychrosphaera sp. B3R10]|uniref:efflux RND transporter periplasmic adaptor subunit n=1 Tax=unclassified Psychrosphaera TaxID=2641570 RepID=UPI001C0980F8|nr:MULTISPECIES: efflux RND transporter periplasmic adaptor subunit [unclassified Psychrosphaera]MBU2883429.1 efflux RND transporter periplasmic adaptor subunit [Psychrosphaera sp. I2R16]MBU2990477.1 efflux RND transporter periplasmic adaptor subunit [Psychrosphaera sp. B3R10]